MLRWLFFVLVTLTALLAGCSRSGGVLNEASFYGTWSKGANPGDTLVFFNRGGRDIMRYNVSNSSQPYYVEPEFAYKNERLYVSNPYSAAAMVNLAPLEGFAWVTPGRVFKCVINRIYFFPYAYPVTATYTKILPHIPK